MTEETFGGADPTEADLPQEAVEEAPVVEVAPEPEPTVAPFDREAALAAALRRAPRLPSTPFAPTWTPPLSLIGETVLYVMPDGTDRQALLMAVTQDGLAILNVKVALTTDDRVQRQQFAAVPFGAPGEPGTWREAPA